MKIDIEVDKKCELLSVLKYCSGKLNELHLTEDEIYTNFAQKIELIPFCKNFVNEFASMLEECRLSYGRDISLFLRMKNFQLSEQDFSNLTLSIEQKKRILDIFQKLPQFIDESQFDNFISNNQNYYNTKISKFASKLSTQNIENFLIKFYGKRLCNINIKIFIQPVLEKGNFGFNIHNTPCVIKSNKINEQFANDTLIVHEISHYFINQKTKHLGIDFEKINLSNNSIPKAYKKQSTILNEMIVRAIEIVYCYEYYQTKADELIKRHKDIGFNIENLATQFYKNYKNNICCDSFFYDVIHNHIKNIMEDQNGN